MTEHDDQAAVIEWCNYMAGQYPELELLYATPNAGKRSFGAAKYMHREGMRAGIPDLFMPCARQGFHGLFIEMKNNVGRKGTVTEQQKWWLDRLAREGYKTVVCYGVQDAVDEIVYYLGIKE